MSAPFETHIPNHSQNSGKRPTLRAFGHDDYSCKADHVAEMRRKQIPVCVQNVRKLTNDRSFARRLHKFQHKLAKGVVSANDAMILTLDCLLDGKN